MKKSNRRQLPIALPHSLVTFVDLTPAEALRLADLLSHLQAALFDYHACATEAAQDPELNDPEPYL